MEKQTAVKQSNWSGIITLFWLGLCVVSVGLFSHLAMYGFMEFRDGWALLSRASFGDRYYGEAYGRLVFIAPFCIIVGLAGTWGSIAEGIKTLITSGQ